MSRLVLIVSIMLRRAWFVECFFLKPYWRLYIVSFASRKHSIRVYMIFSYIFPIFDKREIGR